MKTLLGLVIFCSLLVAATVTVTQTTVTVNQCSGKGVWRLVHDGKKVITLQQSDGSTQTANNLVCATTQDELQARITALKLMPLPAKRVAPVKK